MVKIWPSTRAQWGRVAFGIWVGLMLLGAVLFLRWNFIDPPKKPPGVWVVPTETDREAGKQTWRQLQAAMAANQPALLEPLVGRRILFETVGCTGESLYLARRVEEDDSALPELKDRILAVAQMSATKKPFEWAPINAASSAYDAREALLPRFSCELERLSNRVQNEIRNAGFSGFQVYGILQTADLSGHRLSVYPLFIKSGPISL
jgi:hypothetical protein